MSEEIRSKVIASVVTASVFWTPYAFAADTAPLPPPVTCAGPAIPNFVPAKIADNPSPKYPKYMLMDGNEGWVRIEYTVSANGEVKDPIIADSMGPNDFVEETLRIIPTWKFTPATRNGKAVEERRRSTEVIYRYKSGAMAPTDQSDWIVVYVHAAEARVGESTHDDFWADFKSASDKMNAGKYDVAAMTLERTLNKRLNMAERAHASSSLASASAMLGNDAAAYRAIKHATVRQAENLQKAQRDDALMFRMKLAIQHGDYADAICTYDALKAMDADTAAPDGAAGKMKAALDSVLKDPAPLRIAARLGVSRSGAGAWEHRMLRPNFSFDQIQGSVTSFRLSCTGTLLDLPIDTEQQWNIPASAGTCTLRVQGSPGASFVLVEES
jgi:TonB family protein